MKHPITLRRIPSPARLAVMKRRARKNGTHVRLLLDQDRDMRKSFGGLTIYDIRGDASVGHKLDEVVVRLRDGTRRTLKNRFHEAQA